MPMHWQYNRLIAVCVVYFGRVDSLLRKFRMDCIRRCWFALLSLQALMSYVDSIAAVSTWRGLADPRRSLYLTVWQRSSLNFYLELLTEDRKPIMRHQARPRRIITKAIELTIFSPK